MLKIEICILCKNELEAFSKIFPIIKKEFFKINLNYFVMDGGSKDGSIKFYKKKKIKYFRQKKLGRGSAIIEAFNITKSDALIFFSPDGNEDVRDIKKIVNLLNEKYDLIIGSRMTKGARNEEDGKILKIKKWANKIFNLFANILFNKKKYVTDSINGFRGITKKKFKILNCDENFYAIEYQMTIRSMKLGYNIKEFPTIESDRIAGISQAPSISTGFTFIRALIREIIVGRNF